MKANMENRQGSSLKRQYKTSAVEPTEGFQKRLLFKLFFIFEFKYFIKVLLQTF